MMHSYLCRGDKRDEEKAFRVIWILVNMGKTVATQLLNPSERIEEVQEYAIIHNRGNVKCDKLVYESAVWTDPVLITLLIRSESRRINIKHCSRVSDETARHRFSNHDTPGRHDIPA